MKEDTLSSRATILLVIAVVAAVICNAVVWMLWDPTLIMNDGIGYLSTASNALKGYGFSTNTLIYTPHFQGRLPAYETVWPIGYPAIIAAASFFGFSVQNTALTLNLIAHSASALLVFVILRRCAVSTLLSATGALTLYFTTEPWFLVVAILSEPVFALLVLATLALFPSLERLSVSRLLVCGALMAAATTVRYSGAITAVSFAAGVGLLCLLQSRQTGLMVLLTRSCMIAGFLLISLMGYIGLQLRIYHLSGNLDRDTGSAAPDDVATIIAKFAEQGSIMAGFRDGWLLSGDADKWTFVLFAFLIICILALTLASSTSHRPATGRDDVSGRVSGSAGGYATLVVTVVLVHTLFYAGYLFYCRISESPLPVSARYLYQLYPGLIIAFYIAVNFAMQRLTMHRIARTTLASLLAIALALYSLAQINMVSVIEEITQRGDDASDVLNLRVSDQQVFGDIVEDCVGPSNNHSIWSNEGVMLHGSTGANTITFTGIYANREFDFNAFEESIQTYRISLFVFIENRLSRSGSYADILSSIKTWLEVNKYSTMSLIDNKLPSGSTVTIFTPSGGCATPSPSREPG